MSPLFLAACPTTPSATETGTDATTTPDSETGTATGDCPVGGLGCPCTQGGGCDVGLVCATDKVCVSETSTTTDGPVTDATSQTTDTLNTTAVDPSTTGPSGECEPANGNPSPECSDPDKPYCSESGVCGGCTVLPADGGCELVAEGKPICNADDGKCVACTADDASQCGGETPACNPDLNECVGCFEHSHCPDTACDILQGECFSKDRVLWVRHDVAASGNCTDKPGQGGYEDVPYCNGNLAVKHAEGTGSDGWTIKFKKTTYTEFYHGAMVFSPLDKPVRYALVHEVPGTQEQATVDYHSRFVTPDPVLTVGPDVTLYVHNFSFMSSNQQSDAAVGAICGQGANLFLDDSVITDARGAGIFANGCDVYLRRSMVYNGRTEGIDITGGALHMVNSFVGGNQNVQSYGGGGIRAEDATLDIVNSTILDNHNEPDTGADSIHCVGAVGGQIRNSVIGRVPQGNTNTSIVCPGELMITNTLLDSDDFKTGNIKKAGEDIMLYFKINKAIGGYLIKDQDAADILRGMTTWKKGDPRHDWEGNPRAAKDGQADYPGADAWIDP